jgi:hypothetical protein
MGRSQSPQYISKWTYSTAIGRFFRGMATKSLRDPERYH